MKISINIANGYRRSELADWFADDTKPLGDPDARNRAIAAWAMDRYGSWCTANGMSDFVITDISDAGFSIDFTYEDDGNAFREKLGGRVVEE